MLKKCVVLGCLKPREKYTNKWCCRHKGQMFHFGCIRERTKADPNEFVIIGDKCLIFIYNNKSEKIAETIIDTEDMERCKPYKWYGLKNKGTGDLYILSTKAGRLAPFILEVKTGHTVVADHKDGNTLDNRKRNLQIITHQQNCIKKKMSSNNTSGYRGVTGSEKSKWKVQIGYNGKRQILSGFLNKEEAALAYNEKAKELFGEFAVLNKIETESPVLGLSFSKY